MKGERRKMVEEICRQWPDRGNLTLAKALYRKHPDIWVSLDSARTAVRLVRGVRGKNNLNSAVPELMKRGYAGQPMPKMPESRVKEWLPLEVKASRTLVLSDIHVPFHDGVALAAAVAWGMKRKPDVVLLNGDALDFFSISRWLRDPRTIRLSEEIKSAIQFFEWMRAKFPKARMIWKHGNHEERYEHFLWQKAPELLDIPKFDTAEMFELGRLGIELVKEQRIIMLGKLPALHGHELPKGMTNPVNQARGQFLRTMECGIAGHGHRTSEHAEASSLVERRLVTNWSTGCLCDLHPEYARVNKWNHGFALVETDKDGAFSVENKRIHHGKVW
jgi:predicted phosphodiesterase